MKYDFTVLISKKTSGETDYSSDKIEVMYTDGDFSDAEIIKNGAKQAGGKYVAIADGIPEFTDTDAFLEELENLSADAVIFNGGMCFKSSLIKKIALKDDDTGNSARFALLMAAKTVATATAPYVCPDQKTEYSQQNVTRLLRVVEDFNKNKSKVPKDIYNYARKVLSDELVYFYATAMLAGKKDNATRLNLIAFDNILKENIVLYIALSKSFGAIDLTKLRKNKFRFSFITEIQLKKLVKNN